jgi:hypothetical protein
MAARTQVRRVGVNVNQAVRVLNETGEAPAWLRDAVEMSERVIARLDTAATGLRHALFGGGRDRQDRPWPRCR